MEESWINNTLTVKFKARGQNRSIVVTKSMLSVRKSSGPVSILSSLTSKLYHRIGMAESVSNTDQSEDFDLKNQNDMVAKAFLSVSGNFKYDEITQSWRGVNI